MKSLDICWNICVIYGIYVRSSANMWIKRKLITQFHTTHGKEYFRPQYMHSLVVDLTSWQNAIFAHAFPCPWARGGVVSHCSVEPEPFMFIIVRPVIARRNPFHIVTQISCGVSKAMLACQCLTLLLCSGPLTRFCTKRDVSICSCFESTPFT